MPSRVSAFFKKSNTLDLFLLVVILCVATWLRFSHLATMPDGFHGDEAVSGLEGERILREGSIGPYTAQALGQPTGPLYLTALSLRLFGSTLWAVRAVSAFLGTLTVLVLYGLVRRHYEAPDSQKRVMALLSAAFLATFHWHIHFSRIGFPVIAWPLCTLLAVWAALEAVRRQQTRWWLLAGFVLGLGIYSYNAHVLCILALGLWLLFYLVRQCKAAPLHRVAWLSCFSVALVLAAVPMLRYALAENSSYFEHSRLISVFSAPSSPWPTLERTGPKIGFLAGRYIDFWDNLSLHSRLDGGDASGIVPIVPILMFLVATVGLLSIRNNKRGPLLQIALFHTLILPLGPTVTLDGLNRRAFALAPFLALLAAVGVIQIYLWVRDRNWKLLKPQSPLPQRAALSGAVLLCAVITFQNVYDYFVRSMPAEPVKWTFGQEIADASQYMNTLPPDAYVYFYSDRWSSQYETRAFLAPRVTIEDRSSQFGTFTFTPENRNSNSYFVLLGQYKERVKELEQLYPNSRIHKGPKGPDGQPTFVALHPQ